MLADERRILRLGGIVVVSFSNRCFPIKGTNDYAALVRLYLETAGLTVIETHVLADGCMGDPLVAVTGRA